MSKLIKAGLLSAALASGASAGRYRSNYHLTPSRLPMKNAFARNIGFGPIKHMVNEEGQEFVRMVTCGLGDAVTVSTYKDDSSHYGCQLFWVLDKPEHIKQQEDLGWKVVPDEGAELEVLTFPNPSGGTFDVFSPEQAKDFYVRWLAHAPKDYVPTEKEYEILKENYFDFLEKGIQPPKPSRKAKWHEWLDWFQNEYERDPVSLGAILVGAASAVTLPVALGKHFRNITRRRREFEEAQRAWQAANPPPVPRIPGREVADFYSSLKHRPHGEVLPEHTLPRNAYNAISYTNIKDGNIMVNMTHKLRDANGSIHTYKNRVANNPRFFTRKTMLQYIRSQKKEQKRQRAINDQSPALQLVNPFTQTPVAYPLELYRAKLNVPPLEGAAGQMNAGPAGGAAVNTRRSTRKTRRRRN